MGIVVPDLNKEVIHADNMEDLKKLTKKKDGKPGIINQNKELQAEAGVVVWEQDPKLVETQGKIKKMTKKTTEVVAESPEQSIDEVDSS